MTLEEKEKKLTDILKGYKSLIIAFSGGVDSTLLLAIAKRTLKDQVVAVTGDSPIHSERERRDAVLLAGKLNVRHIVIPTREMELEAFKKNPIDRCYVCKKNLISRMKQLAGKLEIAHIAHGANLDDLNDYRPGFAAAEEMGVLSPLIEAGFTKADIRALSRQMGLETWDKPAMPCLATRLPYGVPITEKKISQIEMAEKVLFDLGMTHCRVRHHNDLARIEADPGDFGTMVADNTRKKIISAFKEIGYEYISLDLEGYISGSMNRSIDVRSPIDGGDESHNEKSV